MNLEVRILKELRVNFAEVRILQGLAEKRARSGERPADGPRSLTNAPYDNSGAVECGGLSAFGRELRSGWRVGETGGVVDHLAPGFVGIGEGVFFFSERQGVEHDLSEIGEGGGGTL